MKLADICMVATTGAVVIGMLSFAYGILMGV